LDQAHEAAGTGAPPVRVGPHQQFIDILPAMVERAMQTATFLILTALAGGSQHGYA
jgi:hypothetical protein